MTFSAMLAGALALSLGLGVAAADAPAQTQAQTQAAAPPSDDSAVITDLAPIQVELP